MNLTIWSRSRCMVVVCVHVWVFWVKVLCRVGILGLRTYEAKADVAALDYNSRLRGDSTFLSSYSESTQNLGSRRYFLYLSDVCVPSCGSVSDFGGESAVKRIGLCSALLCFKSKS